MKADSHGSMAEREAWMRERQFRASVGGQREAQLLAEANAEAQRRSIARLESELELRRLLLAEAEKEAQLRRSQANENLYPDLPGPRLRRRVRH